MNKIPIAHYWLAAASTGYALPVDWIKWADQIISRTNKPLDWIIEMSLSNDLMMLRKAISLRIDQEDEATGKVISIEDAQVGFYFLMYKNHRLDINKFLNRVFEVAESGRSQLTPERVTCFMREERKEGNVDALNIDQELESFGGLALSQWRFLQEVGDGREEIA